MASTHGKAVPSLGSHSDADAEVELKLPIPAIQLQESNRVVAAAPSASESVLASDVSSSSSSSSFSPAAPVCFHCRQEFQRESNHYRGENGSNQNSSTSSAASAGVVSSSVSSSSSASISPSPASDVLICGSCEAAEVHHFSHQLTEVKQFEPLIAVHPGTQCHRCHQTPIIGPRFTCEQCVNWNTCAKCHSQTREIEMGMGTTGAGGGGTGVGTRVGTGSQSDLGSAAVHQSDHKITKISEPNPIGSIANVSSNRNGSDTDATHLHPNQHPNQQPTPTQLHNVNGNSAPNSNANSNPNSSPTPNFNQIPTPLQTTSNAAASNSLPFQSAPSSVSSSSSSSSFSPLPLPSTAPSHSDDLSAVLSSLRLQVAVGSVESIVQSCGMIDRLISEEDGNRQRIDEQGGTEMLWEALRNPSHNEKLVETVCQTIHHISGLKRELRVAVAKRDGSGCAATLLSLLTRFGTESNVIDNPRLVAAICSAIRSGTRDAQLLFLPALAPLMSLVRIATQHQHHDRDENRLQMIQQATYSVSNIASGNEKSKQQFMQLGGVEWWMSIVRQHRNDGKIVAPVCLLLGQIGYGAVADGVAYRSQFGSAGAVELLLSVLQFHLNSSEVIAESRFAMTSLLYKHDENKQQFVQLGGVEWWMKIMQQHRNNEQIIDAACRMMGHICDGTGAGAGAGAGAATRLLQFGAASGTGAVKLLLEALQIHPNSSAVLEAGCGALGNFCRENEENKQQFMQLGGVEWWMSITQRHPSDEKIVDGACVVLGNICYGNNCAGAVTHRLQFGAAGAVKRLLEILQIHRSSSAVMAQGCVVLNNLLCETEQNKQQLMQLGGVEWWMAIVQHHLNDEKFIGVACVVLRNICYGAGAATRSSQFGAAGVKLLLEALRTHRNSSAVLEAGCWALGNLCRENEEHCQQFITLGGVEWWMTIVQQYKHEEQIMDCACVVLGNIFADAGAGAVARRSQFGSAGAVKLLLEVLPVHCNSTPVWTHGCWAMNQLLFENEENKQQFMALGGVEWWMTIVQQHKNDKEITSHACIVLRNVCLGAGAVIRSSQFGTAGVELLLEILQIHRNSIEVMADGCGAMGNLIWSNDENKQLFVPLGGVEWWMAIMQQHSSDEKIMDSACLLLGNMCAGAGAASRSSQFGLSGAVKRLLEVLQMHRNSVQVTAQGCWAMSNLLYENEENKQQFITLGGVEWWMAMVQQHQHDEQIIRHMFSILYRCCAGTSDAAATHRSQWGTPEVVRLVVEVMGAHDKSTEIVRLGSEFLPSLLDFSLRFTSQFDFLSPTHVTILEGLLSRYESDAAIAPRFQSSLSRLAFRYS